MYRTGKPLHGCANVFVLYLLIIYIVSTLLLVVEEARASTSQRDIKEAEKIVGRFLRNEAGTAWLSGLAKTRSAPLTTQDLMNEILEATRPDGKVWRAASLLSESLEDEALKGIKTESILGRAENWKDLIEHIENQDDIICLYRKNTEETAKKSDDWKKFLRTVSPGYTVHLAIDTGRKYVICLKKIDVQETTTQEISTTQGNRSIVTTSVNPPVVTVEVPTKFEKLSIIPDSGIPKTTNNSESIVKLNDSEKNCSSENTRGPEDSGDEGSYNYDDREDEDSFEEEYDMRKARRGMEDDLSLEFGDYPVKTDRDWSTPIPSLIKEREFYLGNNDRRSMNFPLKVSECNRPIILVVRNGDTPLGYRLGTPLGIPIQRSLGAAKLPWFPSQPASFPKMPQFPKLSLIPERPMHSPKIPTPPFNPFVLSNNFPQLTKLNNLGKPIVNLKTTMYKAGSKPILSQNTRLVYNIPREKMGKPVVKSIAKPIVQTTRNAFVPQPFDMKSRGSGSGQQKSDFVNDSRYSFGNYMPRKIDGPSSPSILNSVIRRPSETAQWNAPTRNIILPRRRIPDEANLVDNNLLSRLDQARNAYRIRQFLQKYKRPQLPPRAPIFESKSQSILQKPLRLSGQQPFINIRSPAQSSPPFQSIRNIHQGLYSNFNPNYPAKNNFVQPNVFISAGPGSPFFNHPCPIPWNTLYGIAKNNPNAINSLPHPFARCSNPLVCPLTGYQFQRNSVPCPSPCDRPVELQIIINGKVEEPLKVSVISKPGQRIEIVGSHNHMMPYGSRALKEGTQLVGNLVDEEENIRRERMHESEEDDETNVNDREEEEKEEDEMNVEVSSVASATDQNEKLDDEHNSTTEFRTQTPTDGPETEGNVEQEIGERFLHEATIETSSEASATEENTTMSAITNSTIIA